uniref:Uncharacterized protein n=3 Tax=Macrostomum lignano TaxID=282301 RepID=A0A1I8I4X6_9PLAT
MANVRARNLPRVREALEKAERARFYKQRTNKYTDEVRLMNSLTGLENQRIAALARIKEQTMDLRMQALHIKEEEEAFLKADTVGFDELKRKVEINKHRNFLQEVKYKPRRIRDDFVRRYERWKAEDAEVDDWRFEMPTRQPQVRLNEQLIYPAKRERKQNFRQYLEVTRRPDSKLGAKAVLRLRDLYTDDKTDADRLFYEELEQELSARSEAESQQQQQQQ